MFNPNKGPLISTNIEKGAEGNYFRVSIYKNTKDASKEIKEAILVTAEIIQSEIDKLNTQIASLESQKSKKQAEQELIY